MMIEDVTLLVEEKFLDGLAQEELIPILQLVLRFVMMDM